ncbi:hypothetical protein [Pedobacter terrae]
MLSGLTNYLMPVLLIRKAGTASFSAALKLPKAFKIPIKLINSTL